MHTFLGQSNRSKKTAEYLLPAVGVMFFFAALKLLADLLPKDLVPWVLRDAGTLAISVFIESFPFVVLGTLISVAVQLFVPEWVFLRLLPRRALWRRAVLSLLGILLPVCECGNVPLARTLLKRGFGVADTLTFVLAAPLLNPVTIVTTYQAFGFNDGILVARIVGGFCVANLIGWLFAKHSPKQALSPGFYQLVSGVDQQKPAAPHALAPRTALSTKLQQVPTIFLQELLVLLPVLALGALAAGALQTATPTQILSTLGSHPVFSVLVFVALAALVSICSTVDAFFMLGFVGVFTPGAIVSFLIFGAMIDVKMLLLLRTTFNSKLLLQVCTLVLLGVLTLGFGVNLFV